MIEGGYLVYRCRRCNELIRPLYSLDIERAIVRLSAQRPLPEDQGILNKALIITHVCKDANYGIADLIGCEFS